MALFFRNKLDIRYLERVGGLQSRAAERYFSFRDSNPGHMDDMREY
jgi:hypothetical protein